MLTGVVSVSAKRASLAPPPQQRGGMDLSLASQPGHPQGGRDFASKTGLEAGR